MKRSPSHASWNSTVLLHRGQRALKLGAPLTYFQMGDRLYLVLMRSGATGR
jgi:hypothetical protein